MNSTGILREKGIKVELLWVPAHIGIVEYKEAGVAPKETTGWRIVRKRNIDSRKRLILNRPPPLRHPNFAVSEIRNQHLLLPSTSERNGAQDWRENQTREKAFFGLRQTHDEGINYSTLHKGLEEMGRATVVLPDEKHSKNRALRKSFLHNRKSAPRVCYDLKCELQ